MVVRLVGNLLGEELEGETEAEFIGTGKAGKQAVVVALATTKAVSMCIEGHAGHNGQRNAMVISKKFARRFQDTVAAKAEAMRTGIVMEFQIIAHDGGQDDFLPATPTVYESMGVHFVGKGMVEKHRFGLDKARMLLQPLELG